VRRNLLDSFDYGLGQFFADDMGMTMRLNHGDVNRARAVFIRVLAKERTHLAEIAGHRSIGPSNGFCNVASVSAMGSMQDRNSDQPMPHSPAGFSAFGRGYINVDCRGVKE
jgi:hypothetical protein